MIRVLEQLIEWRGSPRRCVATTAEYVSAALTTWAEQRVIRLEYHPARQTPAERLHRALQPDCAIRLAGTVPVHHDPRYRSLPPAGFGPKPRTAEHGLGGITPNRSWPSWPDLHFWRQLKWGITACVFEIDRQVAVYQRGMASDVVNALASDGVNGIDAIFWFMQ